MFDAFVSRRDAALLGGAQRLRNGAEGVEEYGNAVGGARGEESMFVVVG